MAQRRTNQQNWANKGEQIKNISANILSIPTSVVAEQEKQQLKIIQNVISTKQPCYIEAFSRNTWTASLMDPKQDALALFCSRSVGLKVSIAGFLDRVGHLQGVRLDKCSSTQKVYCISKKQYTYLVYILVFNFTVFVSDT